MLSHFTRPPLSGMRAITEVHAKQGKLSPTAPSPAMAKKHVARQVQ